MTRSAQRSSWSEVAAARRAGAEAELVDRRIEGVVDELEALERDRQLRLPRPDDAAAATSADMRAL